MDQMNAAIRDTSRTARKIVPTIFRKVYCIGGWVRGTTNLDVGGGPYDLFSEVLQRVGVRNLVYDPFGRSHSHNNMVLAELNHGKCHTATISNVLNVVADIDHRRKLLEFAKRNTSGNVYITIYEGDKSGISKVTRDGFQHNCRLRDFLAEIREVFPQAVVNNGMIVCTS